LDDIVLKEVTLKQAIKVLTGIATKLMNTNALASQIRQRWLQLYKKQLGQQSKA
jgi:hypothetical protein